ncbi:hypothetical protein TNCV_4574421 [Trichonephila clavipes]|nr:hypothetical protein TNCV_4574421 [Trichonephila clavipes]
MELTDSNCFRRELKADCRYPHCAHEWSSQIPTALVERNRYGKEAPSNKSILRWNPKFEKAGCLCKKKSSGRPRTDPRVSAARVQRPNVPPL